MTIYNNKTYLENNDFQFNIVPFHMPKGHEIELHYHEFVEFIWVSQGKGEHLFNDHVAPIKEGDVFIIEPGEQHGYRVQDHELIGYNLLFLPSLLSAEFEILSNVSSFVDFYYVEPFLRQSNHFHGYLQLKQQEQMEMKLLLERLNREFSQKSDGYRIVVKTYLIQLFVFLSRCYQSRQRKPLGTFSQDREIFDRVAEFIALHHAKPLTLEQVSQTCDMSMSSFKTKFKQHTGKTFLEYRNDIRLRTAVELLLESNDKIIVIAEKVGFEDLSFFNKSFKQMYGVTPGEYRKNAIKMQLQHP